MGLETCKSCHLKYALYDYDIHDLGYFFLNGERCQCFALYLGLCVTRESSGYFLGSLPKMVQDIDIERELFCNMQNLFVPNGRSRHEAIPV